MTNVRQLDLSKRIIDVQQVEQGEYETPLYKATYIDGTWVKFYAEVVDTTPDAQHTVQEFINSSASSGHVELDDASTIEARRRKCKDCP